VKVSNPQSALKASHRIQKLLPCAQFAECDAASPTPLKEHSPRHDTLPVWASDSTANTGVQAQRHGWKWQKYQSLIHSVKSRMENASHLPG